MAGRLQGGPRAIALIAYNDPRAIVGDYDAHGWPCIVDADGRFRVILEDVRPGAYDLRLRSIGEAGDTRDFSFSYPVGRDGMPDVAPLHAMLLLQDARAAYLGKDKNRLGELVAEVKQISPANAVLLRKVEHLQRLMSPPKLLALADVPVDIKAINVADLKMETISVGWGNPFRNQVLPEGDGNFLLQVGGEFFESGLYAHAPARHVLKPDRAWKTFTTKYGLQNGHDGSVVFVVKGDGKELFRSSTIRDHKAYEQTLNIANVIILELQVENAGDGATNDWGVWLGPQLLR